MLQRDGFKLCVRHISAACVVAFFHTRAREYISGQVVRQNVGVARIRPAFVRRRCDFVESVGNALAVNDCLVGRHCPRGSRPDHHFRSIQRRIARAGHLELHPNRKAVLVVILDLRLSQRSLFHRGPHHRLGALVQSPIHQELLELRRNNCFGVEIHRKIRIRPVACDAETLELIALDIHPAFGKLATFLTEINDINIVFAFALLAILLFDLPFDRQTVAIPTGNITRVKTHHLMAAHDHILDRFVKRVTDVQMAVRVRRTIMQRKRRAAFFGAQLVIYANLFPTLEPLRLTLGQTCAHWEIGLRQVQRGFVVNCCIGCVSTHIGRPLERNIHRKLRGGAGRPHTPYPGGSHSERRADNSSMDRIYQAHLDAVIGLHDCRVQSTIAHIVPQFYHDQITILLY